MAHKVTMKQPKDHLVNADVEFIVRSDDKKIGTLKVSKGNLVWVPAGNSLKSYRIPWRDLTQAFKDSGKLIINPRD
jgi:hypothetical protein